MPGHPYFEPVRLLHVCPVPGCAELVPYGQPRYEQHSRGSDRRSRAYRKARELVLERDRRRCQPVVLGASAGECSRRLQAHHILEVAQGGTDAPENLVALCRTHYHVARRRGRRRSSARPARPPLGVFAAQPPEPEPSAPPRDGGVRKVSPPGSPALPREWLRAAIYAHKRRRR